MKKSDEEEALTPLDYYLCCPFNLLVLFGNSASKMSNRVWPGATIR